MDHSPQEARLLTQVLPNVAAQFRTTLGNMHAALSSGDDPDACILRQSYYRLLRTVTNLTDAVMLAEDSFAKRLLGNAPSPFDLHFPMQAAHPCGTLFTR